MVDSKLAKSLETMIPRVAGYMLVSNVDRW